ncbi:MAG: tetratricopeptide repeat protein [Bryobacteraceae bacterium]
MTATIGFLNLALVAFSAVFPAAVFAQAEPASGYEAAVDQAEKLFANGDSDGVIRLLAPWVEKSPERSSGQHGLGLAYYQKQDFGGAIRHLSIAIRLEKEGSASWKQTVEILAMAYHFSNRAQDAQPLLEKAITWSEGNANLLYTLAMTHIYTRNRDGARQTFAKLFGTSPDSPQAYLLTADLMIQEKAIGDAEALIREAQKKRPDVPDADYKLGVLSLTKGDPAEAVKYLNKELAGNPGNSLAWHYLGDAYIRLAKWDQAIDPLQRSIWLNQQSARSYILLANVYLQQGRPFVAENALKRAIDIDPQNYEAHFQLARIYHKTGRPELARQEMAAAERLRSSSQSK